MLFITENLSARAVRRHYMCTPIVSVQKIMPPHNGNLEWLYPVLLAKWNFQLALQLKNLLNSFGCDNVNIRVARVLYIDLCTYMGSSMLNHCTVHVHHEALYNFTSLFMSCVLHILINNFLFVFLGGGGVDLPVDGKYLFLYRHIQCCG